MLSFRNINREVKALNMNPLNSRTRNFMKFYYFTINLALIWSLVFTQFAFSQDTHTFEIPQEAVTDVNSHVSTTKSLLSYLKEIDRERYTEVKKIIEKEKLSDLALPKVTYSDGQSEFTFAGNKIFIKMISETDFLVTHDKKEVTINAKMSAEKIKIELSKLFVGAPATTFLKFFISEANANPFVPAFFVWALFGIPVLIAIAIIAASIYFYKKIQSTKETVEELSKLESTSRDTCAVLANVSADQKTNPATADLYNKISQKYLQQCIIPEKKLNDKIQIACLRFKEAKKCLKDSIGDGGNVNNSKREVIQKINFDIAKDKFMISPAK